MSEKQRDGRSARAPGADAGHEKDRSGKYLTFTLGAEEYGIEIGSVREIVGLTHITPVPLAPRFIRGVVNLRGKVLPVVDLRVRFGMETVDCTDRTCIIVLSVPSNGETTQIGILVDSVSEVLHIADEDIEDTPSLGAGFDPTLVLGVAKSRDTVKILLNIEKVLSFPEFEVAAASSSLVAQSA